jgi:hypothetical protein
MLMTKIQRFSTVFCLLSILSALAGSIVQAQTRETAQPKEVLEKLPARNKAAVADVYQAASSARALIEQSRLSGDHEQAREAQRIISPWWNQSSAPVAVVLLQATIEQYLHDFTQAKTTLKRALANASATGLERQQALLTLVSLEKLAGRYADAQRSCQQMRRNEAGVAGTITYSAICQAQIDLLLGKEQPSLNLIQQAQTLIQTPAVKSWLMAIEADHLARQGFDEKANAVYASSVQLYSDAVTRIDLADQYLRAKQPKAALAVLQPSGEPELIRIAYAQQQLGQSAWEQTRDQIARQFANQDSAGVKPAVHARERALFFLWLNKDLKKAGEFALLNLKTQREPIDWWIAQEVFAAMADKNTLASLKAELTTSGLRDKRLAKLQ